MSMKKTDYQLIARIFNKNINDKNAKLYTPAHISRAMACQFADVLKQNNPDFKHLEFLRDCGVTK